MLEIKISDLVGLSAPLKRLIEVIAAGVGAATRAHLVRRDADADAYRIEKISSAIDAASGVPAVYNDGKIIVGQSIEERLLILQKSSLQERAHQRINYIECKRQANFEQVTAAAADELFDEDLVPDDWPTQEWIASFCAKSPDAASKSMQRLWGHILAGEIKKPGTFSLRTLTFLQNITAQDAALTQAVLRFAVFPHGNSKSACIFLVGSYEDKNAGIKNESGIAMTDILYLDDLGIVNSNSIGMDFTVIPGKPLVVHYDPYALIINAIAQKQNCSLALYGVSQIGVELLKIIKVDPDLDYIRQIGRQFGRSTVDVKLVKSVGKTSDIETRFEDIEILVKSSTT